MILIRMSSISIGGGVKSRHIKGSNLTLWSYMTGKAANENNLPEERKDSSSVERLMPADKRYG
jgi:hypothetical protein